MYGMFNPYSLFGVCGGTTPQVTIDANGDFVSLSKNNTVTINPLDNDTADTTLDSITTAPQHGTATINGSSIDYTPNTDYVGQDVIKYKIKDADGNEDEGNIFIYVADVLPEPTICDSSPYKCKIIANKDNQGVGIIFDNKITTTITNNSGNTIELQNGDTLESLDNGASKDIECGTQPYFELFKLYNSKVKVKAITNYPISFDDDNLAVDVYNKTGSDKYIYRNNGNQVISDDDSYVMYKHCKMIANVGDENNVYNEPSRPPNPTPAHYSNISINDMGSYRLEIIASASEDCKVNNNTSADVYNVISGDNNIEVIDSGSNIITTDDRFFANNEVSLSIEYTEPTRPAQPIPAHYSNFIVQTLSDNIDVTATSSEDCDILNQTGRDIKIGDTTVSNNSDLVITENKTITLP